MIKKFSEREILVEIEQGKTKKWEPDRRVYDKLNEIIDVLNREVLEEEEYVLSWESNNKIPPEGVDLLVYTDGGYRVAQSFNIMHGIGPIPEWRWLASDGTRIQDSMVKRWAHLPRRKR